MNLFRKRDGNTTPTAAESGAPSVERNCRGCGEKLDLYSVATQTLKSRLLVRGVDAASVRRAEPYPPPPLGPGVLGARSSFA